MSESQAERRYIQQEENNSNSSNSNRGRGRGSNCAYIGAEDGLATSAVSPKYLPPSVPTSAPPQLPSPPPRNERWLELRSGRAR